MATTLRLLLVLPIACSFTPLAAQCSTVWSSGGPQPELTGDGRCSVLWDPDGAGPATPKLVVGGWFSK